MFETKSFVVFCFVFETISPESHFVDQASLKLTEFHLSLPPSTGIKGVYYHHCHHHPAKTKSVMLALLVSNFSPSPSSVRVARMRMYNLLHFKICISTYLLCVCACTCSCIHVRGHVCAVAHVEVKGLLGVSSLLPCGLED